MIVIDINTKGDVLINGKEFSPSMARRVAIRILDQAERAEEIEKINQR